MEQKKSEESHQNEQSSGFEHSEHDDKIIEQLKQNNIDLPETQVRVRQKTCTFRDVKKDELPTFAKNFQPARRMTLQQIIQKDQKDPSLTNYKKSLLGEVDEEEVAQQKTTQVEIVKIEIVCKDRPDGNIILDFTEQNAQNSGKKEKDKESFIIKEGSVYHMRVYFKVRYDCVYGLKFVNNVWRHFIKVDKYEEMMGSFAPKKEVQVIDLAPEEAPQGFLGRSTYKGKIMFADNDGIVHMQFDYSCKICKKWVD